MFQHTKGIFKASVIAIALVFGLSLIIPQQLVLQHELVVNSSQDTVFEFLENPENMKLYFSNLQGLQMEDKGDGDFIFEGHDGELYRLEHRSASKAKGVEITYYKNEDKQGVFLLTTKKHNGQTLLLQTQFWNLGYNPLTKLMGHQTKDKNQENLQDEMIKLKELLED
ncbi:MAG: hypothetical protein ACJA0Q_001869 [Saprospiraceae bacterium]|jgi:hypothetical protein